MFPETLSMSSKKLYMHNLKKLNGGIEPTSLLYLKNKKKIDTQLDVLKPNTRRSYLIAIVSATKTDTSYKSINTYYYKKMMDLNKELRDSTSITPKEELNWITQETIHNKLDELLENIKEYGTYENVFYALVLGLYTIQPPRRNLDYVQMRVPKVDGFNYIENDEFVFVQYKTAKTYQTQRVVIHDKLKPILDLYLKVRPKYTDAFLVLGKPITSSNAITRILNKIFGKKVSTTMLRKIYLTSKYSDTMKELKQDTHDMGTSSNVAQTNYIKK